MTIIVTVMPAPNPDTCAPDEWDAYLASVDHSAMTWGEVDQHRALVERYTARLLRLQTTIRAETTRLLDARDQTSAEAEALSSRCSDLYQQVLDAGAAVLEARRAHAADSDVVRAAREREVELSKALSVAHAELATANLRAIQAMLDAR